MTRVLCKKSNYSNLLIVEGPDDKYSVIGLKKSHIEWPEECSLWPVWVEDGKGIDQILASGYLTTEIKARNVKIIGVMLDADIRVDSRYQRIRQLCAALFPILPDRMPSNGLIVENDDAKRFGVWIMPDNSSAGDLETFLRYLVPGEQEPLWRMACASVAAALSGGAQCGVP